MSGSKKISELATATALTGSELFPLVQEGETRQAEVSVLRLLSPVQSVNNLTGNVLLALGDLTGVEPIVSAQGVSAAIGAVSLRVDDVETSLSEVSLAIISVQAFLLSEIQVATSGVFTEAPNDGQIYGRQSLTWSPLLFAYDLAFDFGATEVSADAIGTLVVTRNCNIAPDFAGSFGVAVSAPSSPVVAGVLRNGTTIGLVSIDVAGTVTPTAVTPATTIAVSAPTQIQILFPASVAPGLSGFAFTIAARRT
jgi:hypothetical protein